MNRELFPETADGSAANIPSSWSLMAGAARLNPFPKAQAESGLSCGTPSHGLGCACKGKRKPGDPAEYPYAASSVWPKAPDAAPPVPPVYTPEEARAAAPVVPDEELGTSSESALDGTHEAGCPLLAEGKAHGLGCGCKKGKKKNQPPEYVPESTPEESQESEAERVPVFSSPAFAATEQSRMDAAGMPRYLPYGDSTEFPGRVARGPAFLGAGPLGMPTLPPYPTTKCPPVPAPIPPPTYARPGTTFWPRSTPCGQKIEATVNLAAAAGTLSPESTRKFLALAEGAAHLMERAAAGKPKPFSNGRARHIGRLAAECVTTLAPQAEAFRAAVKELRRAVAQGGPARLLPDQMAALDLFATCAIGVETAARNQTAADAGAGVGLTLLPLLVLL